MPSEITSGLKNCTTDTPKLPSPAFTPRAEPSRSLGKKLMSDMLELKPPRQSRTAAPR